MTLTQAAQLTRRTIVVFIVLITLSVAGVIGYKIWQQYYLSTLPPIEEKPEMRFGSLSQIEFPPTNVSSSNFSYSLDTVTGGLPQTPKLIKIYFIPRASVSLMAPERAKKLAENLGFPNGPQALSQTEYEFTNTENGRLIIDVTTGSFHFSKNPSPPLNSQTNATESATFTNPLPGKEELVENFKNYLMSKNLLPEELKNGKNNIIYNNVSVADADSAEISIWPGHLDSLPIVTAAFNRGLIRASAVINQQGLVDFQSMNYIFWPIDLTTFSTYPLKTADQAFSDLTSGRGFIAITPPKSKVSITSIYLAYYQPKEYSPYLQPVFVFEGPEFAALVPAILWTNNPAVTSSQN